MYRMQCGGDEGYINPAASQEVRDQQELFLRCIFSSFLIVKRCPALLPPPFSPRAQDMASVCTQFTYLPLIMTDSDYLHRCSRWYGHLISQWQCIFWNWLSFCVETGIGLFFSALMLGLTWMQSRYTPWKPSNTEEFSSASRNVKPGLIASGIVSAWTWAATLVNLS